jgi:hypothetical protein
MQQRPQSFQFGRIKDGLLVFTGSGAWCEGREAVGLKVADDIKNGRVRAALGSGDGAGLVAVRRSEQNLSPAQGKGILGA